MFITNSYVVFVEEQIVALKGKLRETDSLLQEYEKRQVTALPNTFIQLHGLVSSVISYGTQGGGSNLRPKVATE